MLKRHFAVQKNSTTLVYAILDQTLRIYMHILRRTNLQYLHRVMMEFALMRWKKATAENEAHERETYFATTKSL